MTSLRFHQLIDLEYQFSDLLILTEQEFESILQKIGSGQIRVNLDQITELIKYPDQDYDRIMRVIYILPADKVSQQITARINRLKTDPIKNGELFKETLLFLEVFNWRVLNHKKY